LTRTLRLEVAFARLDDAFFFVALPFTAVENV
jgi:hypothetical protein